MQRPLRPIRHHKYSQESLDILTGMVPEPDRQIQQERWGRTNTKELIDLPASPATGDEQVDTHRCGILGEAQEATKKRLSCARNWYLLQQKFSPGILALVPCGDGHAGQDYADLQRSSND